MDKTKWYRIHHEKLQFETVQHATSTTAQSAQEGVQVAPSTEGIVPLAITKENKRIKKELVENDLDVVSVIDYLNCHLTYDDAFSLTIMNSHNKFSK